MGSSTATQMRHGTFSPARVSTPRYRGIDIRLTNQYNDIPGDPCCPAEATSVSATVKDAFDTAACEVAAQHDIPCIDVYHAFNGPSGSEAPGPLLAPDHTHPSAAGQQKIADLLAASGVAPLG
jgi:lysophospholipase L1-like esterase